MISLAIQAGGQSSRMGQDKGLLPFLGVPLIEVVLQRLQKLAAETYITTNRPEDYAFLGLPCIPDLLPGTGALGGLYTALQAAEYPLVIVVACDMPFANPQLLSACVQICQTENAAAVIPSTALGLEPIHAVYRAKECLPAIEQALAAGKKRMISWHAAVDVRVLSPQETAAHDPQGLAFKNLNTPAEFQEAEAIARALQASK